MGRPRTPIEHGTPKGYLKHIRRGVPHSECNGACKKVWAEAAAGRRKS